MQVIGFIMGIFAVLGMLIGLIPLLGWLNWLVIPFACVGLTISLVSIIKSKNSGAVGAVGMVLCAIALLISLPRLIIGCGII